MAPSCNPPPEQTKVKVKAETITVIVVTKLMVFPTPAGGDECHHQTELFSCLGANPPDTQQCRWMKKSLI